MGRKTRWNLKERLQELKEWVEGEDNMEHMFRESRMRLKAGLASRNYHLVGEALDSLGTWYQDLGCVQILEGDAEGWNTLRQGLLCQYWSMKVRIRLCCDHPKVKCIASSVNRPAMCLAHAMAVREDSMADWLGRRMIQSLDDETFGTWGSTPFGPFVVKLFAVWKEIPLDYGDYDVHPLLFYDEVFDAWDNQERLATALERACEYHVWQEEKVEDEFDSYLYQMFPVEVLAVRRVREDLGLPTPDVEHPLVQSPLAHVPREISPARDEVLEMAVAKIRQDFPGI